MGYDSQLYIIITLLLCYPYVDLIVGTLLIRGLFRFINKRAMKF